MAYLPEFDQPFGHQMDMSRRYGMNLPQMPPGYDSTRHEQFRTDQVIDPMGGTNNPAGAVVGEDKKNSIKEYLADIKAKQAAGMNVVPSFSNVTGSQVVQNVGFGESGVDPAMDPNMGPDPMMRYGGGGEFNLNEYQQAPSGVPGFQDPMEGRNLLPGENFQNTDDYKRMQASSAKKSSGKIDQAVEGYLDEVVPMIAAELGFRLEDGPPDPDTTKKFYAAIREAAEDYTANWYRELDRAMDLLKSGEFSGVEEYIAGGMKDPSLIKKEVAGEKFLIRVYEERLKNNGGDRERAMEHARSAQQSALELIKNGKIDEVMKGDDTGGGGALPDRAGMGLGGPDAGGQPPAEQPPAQTPTMGQQMGGMQNIPPELHKRANLARQMAQAMKAQGRPHQEAMAALQRQFPELVRFF
jgi:hypothetical protein